MARLVGEPGRTALEVEAGRLAWPLSSPFLAANAALFLASALLGLTIPDALYGAIRPVVTLGAMAAVLWLLLCAAAQARFSARLPGAVLHAVAAAGDISLAFSAGAMMGWIARPAAPSLQGLPAYWSMLAALAVLAFARLRAKGAASSAARLRAGLEGEREVVDALRALPDSFTVISDVAVRPHGGRAFELDHVVVGPSVIAAIETKSWRGEIDPGPDEWTIRSGRRVSRLPNPCRRLAMACAALEDALRVPRGAVAPLLVIINGRLRNAPPERDGVTVVEGTEGLAKALDAIPASPVAVHPDEVVHAILRPPNGVVTRG